MTQKKVFEYQSQVRVKLPGKKAFIGQAYSEYRDHPRGERRICVEKPGGAGVAYLMRYVTKILCGSRSGPLRCTKGKGHASEWHSAPCGTGTAGWTDAAVDKKKRLR